MFYILSFLLSWLSGILVILITAFVSYDQFSMIDILSFAMMTFAGFLILFSLIYLIVLKVIGNKIAGSKQFIYFPIIFSLFANLPVYFLIWKKHGRSLWQQRRNSFCTGVSYQRFCFWIILGVEK